MRPNEIDKGAQRRGHDGSWNPAFSTEDLTSAVHDNLRNLGISALDVVNLRCMFDVHGPAEGSISAQVAALADLKHQGLIRHIGLSNVTRSQIAEGRAITEIVCVQNQYNLAHRKDDALIDELADVAARLGATPMQVALAWLLQRSPNILLIPGTSSVGHLHENLAAAALALPADAIDQLNQIGAG